MVSIVLYKPQIPPNTGNIMRLCSNTGFNLHIIAPAGFPLDDKSLRRAKMDYYSNTELIIHQDFKSFIKKIDLDNIFIITKFGSKLYNSVSFTKNIYLLFGSENKGLPRNILKRFNCRALKIPMVENSRSLNLSNSVAIVAYEAWKQIKFSGADL